MGSVIHFIHFKRKLDNLVLEQVKQQAECSWYSSQTMPTEVVDALIAEVERLQSELELHKELYVFSENDMGMMKALRDGARDACASLRAKVEQLQQELASATHPGTLG